MKSYFLSVHDSSSIDFNHEHGLIKSYNEFTKSFKDKYIVEASINESFLTGNKIESLYEPREIGSHHLFHAFSALYSNYDKSEDVYAVVLDGYGNDLSGKVFKISTDLNIDVLYEESHKSSIGGLWNSIGTKNFGYSDFPNNGKAGTLMARASLGNVRFEYLTRLNKLRTKGKYYFNTESIIDDSYNINYSLFSSTPTESELDDLCASLQHYTNIVSLDIFKLIPSEVKKVYFAGGVAHNVSLIKYLEDELDIEIITGFAQGDEGISLGYAFYEFCKKNKPSSGYKLPFSHKEENIYPKNKEIYNDLVEHGVVLNYSGAPEIGNRALGNRSFLALPTYTDIKNILDNIKGREWFRPYGIVILKEDTLDWFKQDIDSPYMNKLGTPNNLFKEKMDSIVHFDNTVRVQTVTKELYPELYNLLQFIKYKTGIPILINTSLNIDTPMLYKNDEDKAKEMITKGKVNVGYIHGERFITK